MKNLNEEVNKIKHLFNFKKGNNLIIEQGPLDGDDTVDKPTPDETESEIDDIVSKSLPECMDYLVDKAREERQELIDNEEPMPMGPITLDMEDVRLRVMLPPITPGYEGIYLHEKGKFEPFCKFNFSSNEGI